MTNRKSDICPQCGDIGTVFSEKKMDYVNCPNCNDPNPGALMLVVLGIGAVWFVGLWLLLR